MRAARYGQDGRPRTWRLSRGDATRCEFDPCVHESPLSRMSLGIIFFVYRIRILARRGSRGALFTCARRYTRRSIIRVCREPGRILVARTARLLPILDFRLSSSPTTLASTLCISRLPVSFPPRVAAHVEKRVAAPFCRSASKTAVVPGMETSERRASPFAAGPAGPKLLRYRVDYAGVAILSRKWGGLLGDVLWNNVSLPAIRNTETVLDN